MTNAACASYNYNTHQQLKDQQGILLCYFAPWRILVWVIAFIKSVYLKQSTNWYIIRIHWIYECGGVETLVLFFFLKGIIYESRHTVKSLWRSFGRPQVLMTKNEFTLKADISAARNNKATRTACLYQLC